MEEEQLELSIPDHKKRERIDIYLARVLPKVSRSQIQKYLRDGSITVNRKKIKPNHICHPFERIYINIPRQKPHDLVPESIPLNIVFEDNYLLVINKNAGMVVHPAYGHSQGTLVHALLAHCNKLSNINGPYRSGIVHRIDKDTSGLLVVAKNEEVHRNLAKQFEKKTVSRQYIALVWGSLKQQKGTVETYLARSTRDRRKMSVSNEGKNAITHFEILERFKFLTLIQLRLETGRTHQIRVHLSHIGHTIFGDQTYGGRTRQLTGFNKSDTAFAVNLLKQLPRQALHARTLGFVHPITAEKKHFDSEIPKDISTILCLLRDSK